MGTTEVFERMRADHRQVLEEMTALEKAIGSARPSSNQNAQCDILVQLLEHQFATHMRAEDDVLFPALVSALPATAGTIEQLKCEHAELRAMLGELARTLAKPLAPDREEQVAVQVQDLADLLRIHVGKEETLAFDLAERVLSTSDFEQLAARISTAGGPRDGATRKENS